MGIYALKSAEPKDLVVYEKHLGEKPQYGQLKWPLQNMKQITDHDLWHNLTIWSPASMFMAGHVKVDDKNHASVVIMPKSGSEDVMYAVLQYFSGPKSGTVEYYQFQACQHDYEHKSGGNCYHIYTCKKCSHRYDIDSSD